MPSTKSCDRQAERGRARERDRDRRVDITKHRSRDRDTVKPTKTRHGSVSPGRKGRASLLDEKDAGRSSVGKQKLDRGLPDTRKIPSLMSTKLRMDEGLLRRERGESSKIKSKSAKGRVAVATSSGTRESSLKLREGFGARKTAVELDRAVKRAREDQDRSSYWNRRVLEAEEKDPNRWGHSGFKELYSRDLKPAGRPKSRSPLGHGRKNARSPIRQKRQAPKRSNSRSRSPSRPKPTLRQERRRSRSTSLTKRNSNFTPLGKRPSSGVLPRGSPMLRRVSPMARKSDRNIRPDARLQSYKSHPADPYDSRHGGKRDTRDRSRGRDVRELRTEKRLEERPRILGKGDRLGQLSRRRNSRTKSRSVSTSSMSPRPKKKRTKASSLSELKSRKGSLDSKSRTSSRRISDSSSSQSRSASSSSNSSKDDDVLEIHADGRTKVTRSSSVSSSSSSDDDSKSESSSSSRESRRSRRKGSDSSSSSSSSSSDSDEGSDISGRINMDGRKKAAAAAPEKSVQGEKSKTKGSESSKSRNAGLKRAASAVAANTSKVSKRTPAKVSQSQAGGEKTKTDDASSKGDSDSDSGTSTDSDSEPRMTLSERFAKLTQMSTDKREFAKPLLSANEIDTKLKVVKDLRSADTKIFVEGMQTSTSQNHRNPTSPTSRSDTKPRSSSPVYNYSDGEKRYSSDERRRYFERMERDEPQVRPEDWSDARVRFEYYRDRGCFNDRPLRFEEYVKWEEWYYQYRDWLQNQGYYSRMMNQGESRGNYNDDSRGSHMSDWSQANMGPPRSRPGPMSSGGRRVEQVRLAPLSSRSHFLGRTDSMGRSIDRAPGGSLIVNIRQGANYGGARGRQVGIIRPIRNNR